MRGPELCKLPPPPHLQSWRFASRRHRAPGRHRATGMQGRWEPGAQQTLPSPDHNSSPAELQQGAERMQRGWNRKKAPFLSPFAHFTYRAAPAVLRRGGRSCSCPNIGGSGYQKDHSPVWSLGMLILTPFPKRTLIPFPKDGRDVSTREKKNIFGHDSRLWPVMCHTKLGERGRPEPPAP